MQQPTMRLPKIAICATAAVMGWMTLAPAADLPMVANGWAARPQVSGWEVRLGAAAHGIGGNEANTTDVMGEVLTPRLPLFQDSFLHYLMLRLHAGGSVNLSDRTSFGYAGFAWTWPLYGGIFFEPFIGAAAHNGSIAGSPTMQALGCDYLFHAGASVGYRFNTHWSLIGTFEHLSNGKQLFGVNCGSNQNVFGSNGNQGLNNYGVKVGYSF